jgi:hypothetical protein
MGNTMKPQSDVVGESRVPGDYPIHLVNTVPVYLIQNSLLFFCLPINVDYEN